MQLLVIPFKVVSLRSRSNGLLLENMLSKKKLYKESSNYMGKAFKITAGKVQ